MSDPRPITPHVREQPILCSEFREGRGYTNWRPHGSGDWLLIFTMGGAGRIRIGRENLRSGPGAAVLFAPGAEQDYSTDPEVGHWHLRWAHFEPRPAWRQWLLWIGVGPRVGRVELDEPATDSVSEALGRMLLAHRLGGATGADLAMNALEEALIRCAGHAARETGAGSDVRVHRAVRYMATHLGEPFRMNAVAAHCGLSVSRLGHLFRESTGTTPQKFSEKLRLESARDLLAHTTLNVAEVAAEFGFADPLYFSRRYRRAFGHAPSHGAVRSRAGRNSSRAG